MIAVLGRFHSGAGLFVCQAPTEAGSRAIAVAENLEQPRAESHQIGALDSAIIDGHIADRLLFSTGPERKGIETTIIFTNLASPLCSALALKEKGLRH